MFINRILIAGQGCTRRKLFPITYLIAHYQSKETWTFCVLIWQSLEPDRSWHTRLMKSIKCCLIYRKSGKSRETKDWCMRVCAADDSFQLYLNWVQPSFSLIPRRSLPAYSIWREISWRHRMARKPVFPGPYMYFALSLERESERLGTRLLTEFLVKP